MTKPEIRKIVTKMRTGLNRNAVNRMIGEMGLGNLFGGKPTPTTPTEVEAWVQHYLAMCAEEVERQNQRWPNLKTTVAESLNESADELAWEAAVS
jgi:hypothetical protein